jgi:hypothetical protein
MASPAGSFQEVPDSEEGSQVSSPSVRVCRCENQLAHWDWAGRPHHNLPDSCRPRSAIGNGPGGVTHLEMESQIAVDDGIGKISVQLLTDILTNATEGGKKMTSQSDFELKENESTGV